MGLVNGGATYHSLPGYHGGYVALWCILPALLVVVIWLVAEPFYVQHSVIAGLPDELRELAPEQVELVLTGGLPNMMSSEIATRWNLDGLEGFAPIRTGSVERLVRAPISELIQTTRESIGGQIMLAGRPVSG